MMRDRRAPGAAKPRAPAKRRRALPQERRESLIEACLRSLAKSGREGASVRRIAAEAGVSTGLINHHYSGVSALVADAYRRLAGDLLDDIRAAVERHKSPAARVDAFIAASLTSPALAGDRLNAWLVFWSMINHAPEMQSAHDETFGAYRQFLESLLLANAAPGQGLDAPLAATGLSALLDGLWLEMSFNPRTFSLAEAQRLCRATIRGLKA